MIRLRVISIALAFTVAAGCTGGGEIGQTGGNGGATGGGGATGS
ncbi:MAG: hypothetical protein JWN44_3384, partial [Myxococcales bacterium]|nr:hypothetical protein [Myxococcales bacterium]